MARSERALYDRGEVDVSRSIWSRNAPPTSHSRLQGEHTADVAVVGGGLAGSSVALHLAEAGARVALVEALEPGWGASGRNAGHSVPYRDLDAALAKLPDGGEGFLGLLRDGGGIVYDLATKHAIDCDAVQGGYLQIAHHAELVGATERKAETWAARGYRVRFVDRKETCAMTGAPDYHGAVLAEEGGRVNPFLFTRGLAAAAERSGASIFAHSPAKEIQRVGARWIVRGEEGAISADRVVVCTNGYTTDLVPELERAWCPLVAFAIATRPLPEDVRASVLPSGCSMSLLPTGHRPFIVDRDGRAISSLLARNLRPQRAPFRWLERWLRRTFPQLRDAEIGLDAYWTGSMAWSEDQLPRIFEVAPGLLALTCFSGEGNVMAPLLGKHLAEALTADDLGNLVLPVQSPRPIAWRGRYHLGLRRVTVPAMVAAERLGLY